MSPRLVFSIQVAVLVGLGAAHVALKGAALAGAAPPAPVTRLFDLDGEGNVPTWVSSASLAWAALAAARSRRRALARGHGARARWLAAVAATLAVLSLDETAQVHEAVAAWLLSLLAGGAVPPIAVWGLGAAIVLPLGAALAAGAARHAEPRERRGLVVAGCVYVACGLGLEALGHAWARRHGWDDPVYVALVVLEECGEMLGAALAARSLGEAVDLPQAGEEDRP